MATVSAAARASGSARMAIEGAILQNFWDNIESNGTELLAGVDTLCCDKTGTMSQNRLQLGQLFCVRCSEDELMLAACASLPPDKTKLDPIDRVYLDKLDEYPDVKAEMERYRTLSFEPFNPETKMWSATVEGSHGKRWRCVRGAPKAVLELCKETSEEDVVAIKDQASRAAYGGLRTIAVAQIREGGPAVWRFMGLTSLNDSPRPETSLAVQRAKVLGIDVKLLTGDALAIANKSAADYSLSGGDVVNAGNFLDGAATQSEQSLETILEAKGYGEVFPEHKLRILKILQQHGRTVAMTGDGTADAASLKQADCAIAVEGAGVDARSTADVAFLKPGIERIVANVEISRQIFHKIDTYFVYRTATALCLTLALIWTAYRSGGTDCDVVLSMTSLLLIDVAGMHLAQDDGSSHVPTIPCRWGAVRFLRSVMTLAIFLGLTTVLIQVATARFGAELQTVLPSMTLVATAGLYWTVRYGGVVSKAWR